MTENVVGLLSGLDMRFEDLFLKARLDVKFAHEVGVNTDVSLRAWERAARSCRALELYCKQRAGECS